MARPKLVVRGKGFEQLKKRFAELERQPFSKVGVLGRNDARPDGELGNVDVAVITHFGDRLRNLPGRPFLELALEKHGKEWEALMKKLLTAYAHGKITLRQVLELLGERASADVRKTITTGAGVPPPNAPATIKRKGSSRPLVDSGRLVQSISSEAVTGG